MKEVLKWDSICKSYAVGPRDHITPTVPTLISLHWLLERITYKLCTMMHSVFYGQAPLYISEIVTPVTHLPGRMGLTNIYVRRKTETTTFHVYSLDSVSVRSRCLDLMPGTVCLVNVSRDSIMFSSIQNTDKFNNFTLMNY